MKSVLTQTKKGSPVKRGGAENVPKKNAWLILGSTQLRIGKDESKKKSQWGGLGKKNVEC